MEDRKAKPSMKVVHRNDRAQIKGVLAGSGQALLPMLELLEGAKASIDELMLPARVVQAVPDQVHDAGLQRRGREDRPEGLGHAFEAIGDGDQDVRPRRASSGR